VVHGFGEHIDRYHHVFRYFASNGYAVHGYDQRGFGKTGRKSGKLGQTGDMAAIMADVTRANQRIRMEGVPHFVFGHSMGGLIVLHWAHHHGKTEGVRGIVVSAPALVPSPKVRPNAVVRSLVIWAAGLLPNFTATGKLNGANLCRDPEVVTAYQTSPLNYAVGSLQGLKDMLQGGERLEQECSKTFFIPFLLAHGSLDETTDPASSKRFFDNVPTTTDKTLRIWEGLVHELHNEPEKEQVLATYVEWLNKHLV
jgi:acylglycerol lipase